MTAQTEIYAADYLRALSSLAAEGFGEWAVVGERPIVNFVRYRVSLILGTDDRDVLPSADVIARALDADPRFGRRGASLDPYVGGLWAFLPNESAGAVAA